MAQLFELTAALTLDTAAFVEGVRQAEASARSLQTTLESRMSAAAASMQSLSGSATSAWHSIAASIQSAIDKIREFASLGAPSAPATQGYTTVSQPSSSSAGASAAQPAAATVQPAFSSARDAAAPVAQPFATGVDYVPYNNFPARLHEGEAVLTKLEAAQWRNAETPQSLDLSAFAQAVSEAVAGLTVQMDGETVGRIVAPSVDKIISNSARARRYA